MAQHSHRQKATVSGLILCHGVILSVIWHFCESSGSAMMDLSAWGRIENHLASWSSTVLFYSSYCSCCFHHTFFLCTRLPRMRKGIMAHPPQTHTHTPPLFLSLSLALCSLPWYVVCFAAQWEAIVTPLTFLRVCVCPYVSVCMCNSSVCAHSGEQITFFISAKTAKIQKSQKLHKNLCSEYECRVFRCICNMIYTNVQERTLFKTFMAVSLLQLSSLVMSW